MIRGCGRQTRAAIMNAVTYWCLGLPLSLALAFKLRLGVFGLCVPSSAPISELPCGLPTLHQSPPGSWCGSSVEEAGCHLERMSCGVGKLVAEQSAWTGL